MAITSVGSYGWREGGGIVVCWLIDYVNGHTLNLKLLYEGI